MNDLSAGPRTTPCGGWPSINHQRTPAVTEHMSELSREWLAAICGVAGALITLLGKWALKAIGLAGTERRADYRLFFDEIKALRLEMDRRDERYAADLKGLRAEHEVCRKENALQQITIIDLQRENKSQADRIGELEREVKSLRAESRVAAIVVSKDNVP